MEELRTSEEEPTEQQQTAERELGGLALGTATLEEVEQAVWNMPQTD